MKLCMLCVFFKLVVSLYFESSRVSIINLDAILVDIKVSKGAKIRNRYNQVPHLTQDNNGKVNHMQYFV